MKIGDKVYCHKECVMTFNRAKVTTVGKFYVVVDISLVNFIFYIIDDENDKHSFYLDDEEYFIVLSKLRKKKIE